MGQGGRCADSRRSRDRDPTAKFDPEAEVQPLDIAEISAAQSDLQPPKRALLIGIQFKRLTRNDCIRASLPQISNRQIIVLRYDGTPGMSDGSRRFDEPTSRAP
jgi:hypothetical protein